MHAADDEGLQAVSQATDRLHSRHLHGSLQLSNDRIRFWRRRQPGTQDSSHAVERKFRCERPNVHRL